MAPLIRLRRLLPDGVKAMGPGPLVSAGTPPEKRFALCRETH
jgi:hypothetical protein